MLKNSYLLSFALAALVASGITSCKKEETTPEETTTTTTTTSGTTNYTVPAKYDFANADFSTSTKRIAMLGELTGYIRITHVITAHGALDAQKLKDLYANANAKFADAALNTSGIQLKDKTALTAQAEIEANFDAAAAASIPAAVKADSNSAKTGVAGKLISGTRYILVDSAGFEFKEFVEKGVMGGVFYYQGTTILNSIGTFDNSTKVGGTTAQERAWDEAFGYFGVPIDFPTNLTGLKNWGSYCNSVSIALSGTTTINKTIMDAWLKGRAAISNKDNAGRDAARDIVVKTWEKVGAARFITYVKQAKGKLGLEQATVNHTLSEGVGFIRAFKYNSKKTISDADIDALLNYFKTGNSINLYKVTSVSMDNAIAKMAFIFGLDASKL